MKFPDLRHLDGYLPPDMEKAYRVRYLKDDTRIAIVAIAFFCFLLVAFAFNDYVLFGLTSLFYLLISLRLIYLVYFILLFIWLQKNTNPGKYEWNLFAAVMAGFVLVALINLTRPSNYLGNFAVDTIVILVFYLGVPMRLLFRSVGGIVYALGEIVNFMVFRLPASEAALYAALIVLIIANALGIFASTRLYSFRRREFRAAAELRKQTELLSETGRTAKVGGWEFDVATQIQRWTDEVYRIHELDLSHQPNVEGGIKFYAPEARPVIYAAFERTMETGEPFDLELPFITAKGNRRWVHSIGRGYVENGKITRVAGTFQDITQRKISEEKIQREAEQWQTTFDAITDLVSIQDNDHKLVRVNKAYADTFKMKPEELIGRSCFAVVHGTSCPIDNCPQQHSMQTKNSVTEEIFEPRMGIYMEVSCSPIFNEHGEMEGTVHIVQNITQRKKDEEERRRAGEQIEDLYNNAPSGYHSVDKDGVYVLINDTELSWLGYSREEIIGQKKFSDFLTPESMKLYSEAFPVFIKTGRVKDLDFDIVHKNGTVTSVLVSATTIKDAAGNYVMSRATLYDVTEIRRLQKMAEETEQKYRTILEEMNDAYFEVDLNGNFTLANNTLCRMLLVTKEKLIGSNFKAHTTEEYEKALRTAFTSIFETGEPSKGMVFNAIRGDGSSFYVEISVSPMRNKKGKFVGFRCVGRDVSERVEFQNKIAEMAMHDSLTNLPNRSLLYDRFNIAQGQAERGNRKMAVLELDLDHFKLINDTMGHAAGDELLQAMALRLTDSVRKSDTVARLGGDEFVVLVPEISHPEDAIATARKILAAVNQPFTIDGTELTVTTSIGIAIYPDNGSTMEKLLEAADTAMYDIKGQGRNNYKLAGVVK